MRKLLFSALARADIEDIWFYIARESGVERADAAIDRMTRRLQLLCEHPYSGPVRRDIAPDARCLVHERWMVLYRVDPDALRVVRIVDATRDLWRLGPL